MAALPEAPAQVTAAELAEDSAAAAAVAVLAEARTYAAHELAAAMRAAAKAEARLNAAMSAAATGEAWALAQDELAAATQMAANAEAAARAALADAQAAAAVPGDGHVPTAGPPGAGAYEGATDTDVAAEGSTGDGSAGPVASVSGAFTCQ